MPAPASTPATGSPARTPTASQLPLPDGSDTVCVYAINQGTGQNSTLGCPVAKVSGSPIGMLDTASVDSDGHTATVTGWTYDYDAPTTALKAVLYLNGKLAAYGPTLGAARRRQRRVRPHRQPRLPLHDPAAGRPESAVHVRHQHRSRLQHPAGLPYRHRVTGGRTGRGGRDG